MCGGFVQRLIRLVFAPLPQMSAFHPVRPSAASRHVSDIIYPRSPKESMAGWVYLPRLVDKIRLHLAGRLHPDYQANFLHKGFDKLWFDRSGVLPEDLVEVVRQSVTDGEVCDWVARTVRKSDSEKAAHREYLFNHGRVGDDELKARLQMRKEQSGLGHRDDLQTFVDYIDADEKRG
jgi:hypothetical protein